MDRHTRSDWLSKNIFTGKKQKHRCFPFHGIEVPSKLHQFMVSEVRRWSLPAGKSCRGKTYHAAVPSAPSVPPKGPATIPAEGWLPGAAGSFVFLGPGAQQARNTGTQGSTGLSSGHRTAPIRSPQNSPQMAPSCWKEMEEASVPQALLPHSFGAEPRGCSASSAKPQHSPFETRVNERLPWDLPFGYQSRARSPTLPGAGVCLGQEKAGHRSQVSQELWQPCKSRQGQGEPSAAQPDTTSSPREGKEGPNLASSPKRSHGSTTASSLPALLLRLPMPSL